MYKIPGRCGLQHQDVVPEHQGRNKIVSTIIESAQQILLWEQLLNKNAQSGQEKKYEINYKCWIITLEIQKYVLILQICYPDV